MDSIFRCTSRIACCRSGARCEGERGRSHRVRSETARSLITSSALRSPLASRPRRRPGYRCRASSTRRRAARGASDQRWRRHRPRRERTRARLGAAPSDECRARRGKRTRRQPTRKSSRWRTSRSRRRSNPTRGREGTSVALSFIDIDSFHPPAMTGRPTIRFLISTSCIKAICSLR